MMSRSFLLLFTFFSLGCDLWKTDPLGNDDFWQGPLIYDGLGKAIGRLEPASNQHYFTTLEDGAILNLKLDSGTQEGGIVSSKLIGLTIDYCHFSTRNCSGYCYVGEADVEPLTNSVFIKSDNSFVIFKGNLRRESVVVNSMFKNGACFLVSASTQSLYPVTQGYSVNGYPFIRPLRPQVYYSY